MKNHADIAFWKEHVAAALQDPVSISAYAKRHSIAAKSLYYWNKKISQSNSAPKSDHAIASPFVAVRVPEKIDDQRGAPVTLVLAQEIRLEMATLPTPEWLAKFLGVMQGVR